LGVIEIVSEAHRSFERSGHAHGALTATGQLLHLLNHMGVAAPEAFLAALAVVALAFPNDRRRRGVLLFSPNFFAIAPAEAGERAVQVGGIDVAIRDHRRRDDLAGERLLPQNPTRPKFECSQVMTAVSPAIGIDLKDATLVDCRHAHKWVA